MATSSTRRSRPRRLRRLAGVAVLLGAGLPILAAPAAPIAASAADVARSPSPTCPSPPLPVGNLSIDACPASPSPEIVVISPVPLDPPPPPSTPSYLIGTLPPTPAPSPDAAGSPVPLGGGFNNLPSPNTSVPTSSSSNSGGGGIPLPLLLAGFVVLAGGAGAVLYAVAPRGDHFPEKIGDAPVAGFSPYRSEGSELNIVDAQIARRPRPRRPRAGL